MNIFALNGIPSPENPYVSLKMVKDACDFFFFDGIPLFEEMGFNQFD